MSLVTKPQPGEYAPYASMYIDLLPDDGQVLKHLRDNLEATKTFIHAFPEEKLSERIFAYRAWTRRPFRPSIKMRTSPSRVPTHGISGPFWKSTWLSAWQP